jgi:23S rRNA (uracil-5-)-methyltransferase RumA
MKNGKANARLLEVVKESLPINGRLCSHFGACGGCNYLSLPYDTQLHIKEQQVRLILERALLAQESEWTFQGITPSPNIYEYRNKMEFSFGDAYKDGPLTLGMHKRDSFYDVAETGDCLLVDEDFRLIQKAVLSYFRQHQTPYYHRMKRTGFLRHLLLRKAAGTHEILLALVTTKDEAYDEQVRGCMELLRSLRTLQGEIVGLLHIENDSIADVVKNQHVKILYGRTFFMERILELSFKISAFSFFQTNTRGAEVLYEIVRQYCKESLTSGKEVSTIFDLYCGTGTITQIVAPLAKKVVGVEIVEEAVMAARENAALNEIANCEFIAGDVLTTLDELADKPDLIILDPPRDGVHPKALPKILAYQVEYILYISCKPTSLARDLATFLAAGYHMQKAVAVDLFPWTSGVETVCILTNIRNNF